MTRSYVNKDSRTAEARLRVLQMRRDRHQMAPHYSAGIKPTRDKVALWSGGSKVTPVFYHDQ